MTEELINSLSIFLLLTPVLQVRDVTAKIAQRFQISGPFNIQFLAKDNDIKVRQLWNLKL